MSESLLGQESKPVAPVESASNPPAAAPVDVPEFLKGVEPSLLQEASVKNVKDLNSLVKSYVHAQKMIGADKVVIPSKEATPQQWNEVFRKLGLPESVDKYGVELPKESKINPAFASKLKQVAFESGILPQQLDTVLKAIDGETNTYHQEMEKQIQAQTEQAINGLKQEWGDGFNKNIAHAKEAVELFGGEPLKKYLNESGLGNDPMLIKAFSEIGKKLGEGKVREGTTELTPTDINGKLADLMNNPSYFNQNAPDHNRIKDEVSKLMRQLHG